MLLLIAALTIGFILSLLALGSFISFRVFDFPDITTEGSFTLGGAIVATLLVAGVDPLVATAAACAGGVAAGTVTGSGRSLCAPPVTRTKPPTRCRMPCSLPIALRPASAVTPGSRPGCTASW